MKLTLRIVGESSLFLTLPLRTGPPCLLSTPLLLLLSLGMKVSKRHVWSGILFVLRWALLVTDFQPPQTVTFSRGLFLSLSFFSKRETWRMAARSWNLRTRVLIFPPKALLPMMQQCGSLYRTVYIMA